MNFKLFNKKDLDSISKPNIVEFIIEEVNNLEKEISLNKLNESTGLIWENPKRKIHINNLVNLLDILFNECKNEPMTTKLLIELEPLLQLLKNLKNTFGKDKIEFKNWLLGKQKTQSHTPQNPHSVNIMLDNIIKQTDIWKKIIIDKIKIPLGNEYTKLTYHPKFYNTYLRKPSILPNDYKSNFFFEVYIKELCPYTTLIQFHPVNEVQIKTQSEREIIKLFEVDLDVDLQDKNKIEESDNIRGIRIHGPSDNKELPGSYIALAGGHHRIRVLYQLYLEGKIDGNKKILFQLIEKKDLPDSKNYLKRIEKEIILREKIRKKVNDYN